MSTRIIKELVDDIDGNDAEETLTFAVNGITYEIDLSTKNLTTFHEFMQLYITNARRQTGSSGRPPRRSSGPAPAATVTTTAARSGSYTRLSKEQNKALREWAVNNGHNIPARGRIPRHIVDAFEAAHVAT